MTWRTKGPGAGCGNLLRQVMAPAPKSDPMARCTRTKQRAARPLKLGPVHRKIARAGGRSGPRCSTGRAKPTLPRSLPVHLLAGPRQLQPGTSQNQMFTRCIQPMQAAILPRDSASLSRSHHLDPRTAHRPANYRQHRLELEVEERRGRDPPLQLPSNGIHISPILRPAAPKCSQMRHCRHRSRPGLRRDRS